MCLYRDGRDSVAWHGDRVGRAKDLDTMVAILRGVGPHRPVLVRAAAASPAGSRSATATSW